jgi:hypothetical protein
MSLPLQLHLPIYLMFAPKTDVTRPYFTMSSPTPQNAAPGYGIIH